MARSIYATFTTERDAERATGALLDHGLAATDVSFVISDPLLHPTVFHPEDHAGPALVDALPPPTQHLPGTFVTDPLHSAPPHPIGHAGAVGSEADRIAEADRAIPLTPPAPIAALPSAAAVAAAVPPIGATVMPPNTPQGVVETESRPHIIDMESDRPAAADGISTTTAADAAKGAVGGVGIGAGLGVLLGLAAVLIPGVGLVAGAGALVAGLAAATGVAGGIAGGAYGYLADMGIPQHNAKLLGDHLKAGGVVLHVEVSGQVAEDEIVRLLTKYGATSAQGF